MGYLGFLSIMPLQSKNTISENISYIVLFLHGKVKSRRKGLRSQKEPVETWPQNRYAEFGDLLWTDRTQSFVQFLEERKQKL